MGIERGAKMMLLLASVVVVAAGIRLAEPLLVPFLLAAFIATVTAPLVLWLRDRGVPRGLAVLSGLLVDLASVAGLAALVGGSINAFYGRVPQYQQTIEETAQRLTSWLASYGVEVSPDSLTRFAGPEDLMDMVASLLRSVAGVVSNIVLVLLIIVFMLSETLGLRAKVARALSDADAAGRLARAAIEVNKYLLVKTGTSAATGIAVGVWVWFWGVDLPLLWGLLAFLLNYIPTLGSILASVPAILLALLQLGVGPAIAVASGYLFVNFLIGNFLEPRIFGRALGMSPLVVFLSVVVWGWLLGPFGALLSVPLTMMIKIFLQNTDDLRWVATLLEPAQPGDRGTIPPNEPPLAREATTGGRRVTSAGSEPREGDASAEAPAGPGSEAAPANARS
jgi:predicted PurR-regulated permease PerM